MVSTAELTAKERVGRGLDLLARGLRPFVDQHMGSASAGNGWVQLLEARDELRTGRARQYSADDPRFLLRVLTEERRVFGEVLSRADLALASELREVGNRWAHEPAITDDDGHRALDTMERLLTAVGTTEIALQVRAIRLGSAGLGRVPTPADAAPSPESVAADEPASSMGIATIRDEIIEAELVFSPAVNYALVHNGLSPLRSLAINNPGDNPLVITSVEVRLEAPLADIVAPAFTFPGFELATDEAAQVPTGALRWAMNPVAFARLDEAVGAQLHLIVNTTAGRFHAEESILLLARDEWWANAIPESLAAFIAPRDRGIVALLDEASTLLQTRTSDPSFPGYQAGSERVLDIAHAIYDAMRDREIRYINPPPSYEGTGQKIRSHREVLDDRWGTCLDLTCAYAAALEAAGLNPVTVMCDGHAFAGVLVDDVQLPEVALTDANTIVNLIDSRMLVTVETTAIATGPNSLDFTSAQRATSSWFTQRLEKIENVLDVRRAHRRVRPMPSVNTGDGAAVAVDVERRADRPRPLPRIAPQPDTGAPTARAGERITQDLPPRIARWRNSLLDLSFRNPLLNMRTGRSGLDLHVPAGSLATLEDMIAAGQVLTLLPNDELDDIHRAAGARTAQDIENDQLADLLTGESILFTSSTQAAYPTRLKGLVRKAHTVIEETGANNLFLALGSLLWDDAGREARAPLFLVPVTLKARRGRPFQLQIEDGGYAIPNQCLLEKLRISKGLVVPSFETPELDESGINLDDSLQQIRVALVQANLRYRVEETAHLAILQFSTLQLWQDLGDNWPSFLTTNPVVRHMVETPTDTFVDAVAEPGTSALAEAEAYLPIAVDGSQLEAVRWAAAGRSFVLEGPPGTGKSQTITNLIANSLAEGRRVLFVAEKQAALDVVRRRLVAVGLGVFSLDLHGKTQTPAAVREQLRKALNASTSGNPSSWEALRSTYTSLVANLARYPEALHAVGAAGLSAWTARQVILTLGTTDPTSTPEVPESVVSGGVDVEHLYVVGRALADALQDLGASPSAQPWVLAGAASDGDDRTQVVTAHSALVAADAAIADPTVRAVVEPAESPDQLGVLANWLDQVQAGTAVTSAAAEDARAAGWGQHAGAAYRALEQHQAGAAALMTTFQPTVLAADLDRLLAASVAADRKLFKKKPRLAVISELASTLQPAATVAPDALTGVLHQLVKLRADSLELDRYLAGVPSVMLPTGWNPLAEDALSRFGGRLAGVQTMNQLVERVPSAVPAADRLLASQASTSFPAFGGASPGVSRVGSGGAAVRALADAWTRWFATLDSASADIDRWQGDRVLAAALRDSEPDWSADLARGGPRLGRWGNVQRHLRELESAGLQAVSQAVRDSTLPSTEIEHALRLGVAKAALAERLGGAGLDGFDAVQRERSISRYLETGVDVRRQMINELPARIVAARTFQTNRLVGRVGELNRELGRKRGGLSIRGLLDQYGSVIGEITPCLLMSPHSVARFLPPGSVDIDLVVYDEASQIKVAEAIGAMGRARSVVVVGDSKQMPPSTFGGGDPDEDDDAAASTRDAVVVPTDQESILSEAVESNLPSLWLSWHYRSQDESLIAFSNKYYYEGRLASFPGPPEERVGMGVRWRRVDGSFERGRGRVNRIEAEAILADIRARLVDDPTTSIGVVTFNSEQRDLVLDLLEGSDSAEIATALAASEDPLFVKNLENVQGDERDVILFSLAFSPDPVTGKLPLNFGPLNRSGGERRLNVAITRARRQVVLYSSFDPEHIEGSRTNSVGLMHLRDYLMLAARGSESGSTLRAGTVHDLHRDEIAAALRAAGLDVRTEIGLSDFTVDLAVSAGDGAHWVAVLLDGPGWAKRHTVSDRDAVPTTVLGGTMGWSKVERIWLPSWLSERDDVVARIVQAANRAAAPPVTPSVEPIELEPADTPEIRSVVDAAAASPVADVEPATGLEQPPFVAADDSPTAGGRDLLDRLDERAVFEHVQSVAMGIIRAESPIEATRLARIVGRRFGLQRVVGTRSAVILAVVPRGLMHTGALGTFVWLDGTSPESYTRYRPTPAGVDRSIHEVASEELANAMEHVARIGHGVTPDELLRETAAIFGVRRLTEQIRVRLQQTLDWSLAAGRLHETDHRILP